MNRYRKLFAAFVGLTALGTLRYLEIDIVGIDQVVIETVVSALTAWGVYRLPNDA